jgi:hypothetical protein
MHANPTVTDLTRALTFAAAAHANQRRKGAAQEPYIDHVIEVLDLVACATGGDDTGLCIAALLHDVIEDTAVTPAALEEAFGPRILRIVEEDSDDMTLPKDERRRQRIAGMARKSPEARIIKIADVISNLRALVASPPAGWSAERKLGYLNGCRQLIDAGRGVNSQIEALFDLTAATAERSIREEASLDIDSCSAAVRQLDAEIGQPVHLVYLPNTANRPITETDVDTFCHAVARSFPAATVQHAEAIFEGSRRPILLARIRSDSTESVVDLAQRLCLTFKERFVGIEIEGRYIRIYADDTA